MKTRRLSTILTSAYLSAMLASSVSPVRSDATFAATIDPTAARQAFQTAVNSIEATNWMAASATPAAIEPVAKIVLVNNPAPKIDPGMTEELMARLVKYAQGNEEISTFDAKACAVLKLCDGTKALELKILQSDIKEHYFGIPAKGNSKDILIIVRNGTTITAYLTDKTGKLRAAVVSEPTGSRLITNDEAIANFKSELKQFAKEAGDLPPTGTSLAGNS